MVAVFKTNIADKETAKRLLNLLHMDFCNYLANFDLEDCDRILRIKPKQGQVCCKTIISWVLAKGYWAEELPDVV